MRDIFALDSNIRSLRPPLIPLILCILTILCHTQAPATDLINKTLILEKLYTTKFHVSNFLVNLFFHQSASFDRRLIFEAMSYPNKY